MLIAAALIAAAMVGLSAYLITRTVTAPPVPATASIPVQPATCDAEVASRVPALEIAFSPRGPAYAATVVRGDATSRSWPRLEDLRVVVAPSTTSPSREIGVGSAPSWSSSGKLLAYQTTETALHYVIADAATAAHVGNALASVRGVGWRDDRLLYFSGVDLHEFDSSGDRVVLPNILRPSDAYPAVEASFSSSGTEFVLVRYDTEGAEVFRGAIGDPALHTLGRARGAGWSPSGAHLLVVRAGAYELVGGGPPIAEGELPGPFTAWSSDGWPLFAAVPAHPGDLQQVVRWDGTRAVTFAQAVVDPPRPFAFSSDGSAIGAVIRSGAISELRLYSCR